MTTRVLTAHVPIPLADKVDQLAARLERSRGWIVRQALSAWVEQEEERRRLTLEALADVDAGHVIDHQAVQAWADSLETDNPLPVPRYTIRLARSGQLPFLGSSRRSKKAGMASRTASGLGGTCIEGRMYTSPLR